METLFKNFLIDLNLFMPDTTIVETNTDRRYMIDDEEIVVRLLSFPSCLDSKGRLTTVAFSLYHKEEDYVSVSRLIYSTKEECIKLGKKIKVWPQKGDSFVDLAELNAGEVRSISPTRVSLDSKYEEKNKAHAGISFKDENGDTYVNVEKGTPSPMWMIPFQQRLCRISKVEKVKL